MPSTTQDAASVTSEPQPPALLRGDGASRTDRTSGSAPGTIASAWAPPPPPQQQQQSAASNSNLTGRSTVASHHSYQVPLVDDSAHRSWTPRHRRSRSRGSDYSMTAASAHSVNEEPQPSLQDRIAATALAGTLELLKQVGGVTLSTTGALVAPPLHITRTILLPNLWAALKDFVSSSSPVRLKDWFRIVSSSLYHVVNTLKNTESGHAFSNRILLVLADFVECVSADTTRQLLLDGMATAVRLSEALHTPEFRAYLDQLAVTGCRAVDAASNGRNKLLLHDLRKAAWSGCALLADPATTTALAEVTAYLCYALEMEQQKGEDERQQRTAADGNSGSSSRRRERNQYQRACVVDKDTLDGGRTVEEVILSSLLGGVPALSAETDAGLSSVVPNSIVLDQAASTTPVMGNISTGRSTNDPDEASVESQEWHERARSDVDVQFLREGIAQRAAFGKAAKQQKLRPAHQQAQPPPPPPRDRGEEKAASRRKVNDDGQDEDVEELLGVVSTIGVDQDSDDNSDGEDGGQAQSRRRQRAALKVSASNVDDEKEGGKKETVVGFTDQRDGWAQEAPESPLRLEGETASQHFHRILDEILTEKRREAVRIALTTTGGYHGNTNNNTAANNFLLKKSGTLRRPGASGACGPIANGTVNDRLAALRAELGSGPYSKLERDELDRIKKMFGNKGKTGLVVGLSVVLAIVLFWFSMGCYGLYVFFHPAGAMRRSSPPRSVSTPASQEIVIRVIKEVVHINQDGRELGRGLWNKAPEATVGDFEKVAECVAAVYK